MCCRAASEQMPSRGRPNWITTSSRSLTPCSPLFTDIWCTAPRRMRMSLRKMFLLRACKAARVGPNNCISNSNWVPNKSKGTADTSSSSEANAMSLQSASASCEWSGMRWSGSSRYSSAGCMNSDWTWIQCSLLRSQYSARRTSCGVSSVSASSLRTSLGKRRRLNNDDINFAYPHNIHHAFRNQLATGTLQQGRRLQAASR